MAYNYIPKYIRQSENKSPKSVVTASRWNELFNLLIQQGDHTAEELGKILDYLSTGLEDLTSNLADAITGEHEYASALEIHLHTNTNPITADKTFAEIRQAIVDGREILLWVSDVQCLKPACKVYESSLMLAVFDNSIPGIALRADVYECSNEDDWDVVQHIQLADQAYVDGRANEKLDKTGGVITGDLGVTGQLNIGTTVAVSETNVNSLKLAGDYGAPVTISNVDTPVADNDAATKKYVDDHAGGGGESVLYVNITLSGSTITGDKTYAEILAAVTAGKCVIAKLAGMSFCLDSVSNAKITFQRLDIVEDDGEGRRGIHKTSIYVYNDGAWTAEHDFIAVDIAMSDTSRMTVQNKVVKAYVDGITPTKTSQLTNDSGFLTSHQDISGKQDKATLEADVAAKGFTKNTGTYSKPAGGIPKADLAAAVQTSLGKADTALQEHQSLAAYRTAAEQNLIDVGKQDKLIAGENITIASDGKTISATGGGAEALIVHVTDNNGTLSADKSFIEIMDVILAGTTVLVRYDGTALPLIAMTADFLWFGTIQCDSGDASNGAVVATIVIEITPNGEVNDFSAQIDIPNAVTDAHINSLIDTKLGVIENGSY